MATPGSVERWHTRRPTSSRSVRRLRERAIAPHRPREPDLSRRTIFWNGSLPPRTPLLQTCHFISSAHRRSRNGSLAPRRLLIFPLMLNGSIAPHFSSLLFAPHFSFRLASSRLVSSLLFSSLLFFLSPVLALASSRPRRARAARVAPGVASRRTSGTCSSRLTSSSARTRTCCTSCTSCTARSTP